MLLATDLDGTFLGGGQNDKDMLYRLISGNPSIQLAFVTGRGVETVMPLLSNPIIPNPDFIICDVGATILHGDSLDPVMALQAQIDDAWPGNERVAAQFAGIRGLRLQEVPQQRRCSFFIEGTLDMPDIRARAARLGCDVLVSNGIYLDVLPAGVSKGNSLEKLIAQLDIASHQVLVAGDTLNDLSLYQTGYAGVVVGCAERALVAATRRLPQVYHAERAGAGGILEAMAHFKEFAHLVSRLPKRRMSTKGENQLVLVYHRPPFEQRRVKGTIKNFPPRSPNGIIPTLLSFFTGGQNGVWISWGEHGSGSDPDAFETHLRIDAERFPNLISSRIPMPKRDIELFYKVFSKEAFWPVIFSFVSKAVFDHRHWQHFLKVNQLFAERAAAEADIGALVWIHEYNLWMLPAFLRQLRPDVRIAFYHHTAFPPPDVFNVIPWHKEIIASLLQCDHVGFHIPSYVTNFVNTVRSHMPVKIMQSRKCAPRFLTYGCSLGVDTMPVKIQTDQRTVRLGAHPVGVDVANIQQLYESRPVQRKIAKLRDQLADKVVILSLERLDYVKGPLEKIRAYYKLLEQHPELHGKVELINVCTPPSEGMRIYDETRASLDEAVGKVNGRYSRLDWVPIRYFYRALPFEEVVAHYAVTDIVWVTPLRDGLNIVAKEYVAVQAQLPDPSGVVVLSEFAGVAAEMQEALRVNPYDSQHLEDVLVQAINLEPAERRWRMKNLIERVMTYDIKRWARDLLRDAGRS